MNSAQAIAFGALWGSIHNLRFMVNRGLVSPNEVDEFLSSVVEAFQSGDEELAAEMELAISPALAEMRQWAEKLWIGRGQTNPR